MKTDNKHPIFRLSFLLLALNLAVSSEIALAKDFTPPDLEGYNLHHERDADGDGDGENETRLRQYLNPNGDSLVSFTTNGRLWAWSLDTRNDDVGPRNYVIRDSNCDGSFDEVYGLDDEFHVPDCAR